jgi:hypothetical protein
VSQYAAPRNEREHAPVGLGTAAAAPPAENDSSTATTTRGEAGGGSSKPGSGSSAKEEETPMVLSSLGVLYVASRRRIRQNYLRSAWFQLDVLSILPSVIELLLRSATSSSSSAEAAGEPSSSDSSWESWVAVNSSSAVGGSATSNAKGGSASPAGGAMGLPLLLRMVRARDTHARIDSQSIDAPHAHAHSRVVHAA